MVRSHPELNIEGFELLHPAEQKFLEGEDEVKIRDFVEILLNPSSIESKIREKVGILQVYAVTPQAARDPRVKEGYALIEDYITIHHKSLAKNKIAMFVGGSLRFDDIINCDLDLVVVTEKKKKEIADLLKDQQLSSDWKSSFTNWWGINDINFDELTSYCRNIHKPEFVDYYKSWIEADFTDAGFILTGYPVYTQSQDQVAKFNKRVIEMAMRYPLVGAIICHGLEACVNDRLSRLSGGERYNERLRSAAGRRLIPPST